MKRTIALLLITILIGSGCAVLRTGVDTDANRAAIEPLARGTVYHDRNHNGQRDFGERGLFNVRVSNGEDVVTTDWRGRYVLPVDDDTIVFVVKPSGWRTPIDENKLPRFYYIHKPAGSPMLKHPGVGPTGDLPASIDFPLYRQREKKRFRMVLFGDPQPVSLEQVHYLGHDVVEELVGVDAALGVSLGDLVGDNLSLFEPLNEVVSHVGIPWYNVLGNHDINYDALDDEHSDETFERVYGPPCYSFDYGKVHFIVIDNVFWSGSREGARGKYHGEIGARQLRFIENDLALTPKSRLVVLMMHIPLGSVKDRARLFELLADRPHTLSLGAHHHTQHHDFFGEGEGWLGAGEHHHLVNVTTSGSWWSGWRDEEGIPHTTMRDGAPNGYSIVTFNGHRYSVAFKAARRPADHQMTIFVPDVISASEAAETEVVVNVFAGSERSKVEMRLGDDGDWIEMQRTAREDPYFVQAKKREAAVGTEKKLPAAVKSTHIWATHLPPDPPPGTHLIHVRTTDMFGRTFEDHRIIRVR